MSTPNAAKSPWLKPPNRWPKYAPARLAGNGRCAYTDCMTQGKKQRPGRSPRNRSRSKDSPARITGGTYWAYGRHAVVAGLANPARSIGRLLATRNAVADIADAARRRGVMPEQAERADLDRLVGADAVHQGLAAQFHPLPATTLEEILEDRDDADILLVLDQITDPHNVGAILRSAAVFGARAVLLQDRNAPPESAALAKASSGALETVPIVRIGNLAAGLEHLRGAGFWCIGLAGEASEPIGRRGRADRVAIVLGAEGDGLRRLTRERCDALVHIPMAPNAVGSLNVSNAAAVALYAIRSRGPDGHD